MAGTARQREWLPPDDDDPVSAEPARLEYFHSENAPAANIIAVTACACVFDEAGALLMIRRADTGALNLPEGAQQVGETVGHAAVREVKEETGINIALAGLVGIYSDPAYVMAYPDGHVRQEFAVCFLAHPVGGQMRVSVESSGIQWVAEADLDEIDLTAPIRLRVEHSRDRAQWPHFR